MKKVLLTAVAVMAFGISNAQDDSSMGFSQGSMFLSGAVGFGSESTGDTKTTDFVVAPKFGYFVTENIALGLQVISATSKFDNGVDSNNGTNVVDTDNEFSGGVFGRYYFTPGSQFSAFANLGVNFGSNKSTTDSTFGNTTVTNETKSSTVGAGLGIGVNYFISNNFALEATWAGLGYESDDNGGNGADKTSSFGLSANLASINLGLVYKF